MILDLRGIGPHFSRVMFLKNARKKFSDSHVFCYSTLRMHAKLQRISLPGGHLHKAVIMLAWYLPTWSPISFDQALPQGLRARGLRVGSGRP